MLKLKLGNTTTRKEVIVSEDVVIKDMLNDNNIDFQTATIMLNGAPLSTTDLNKTVGEAKLSEGDFLVSVVKAQNANEEGQLMEELENPVYAEAMVTDCGIEACEAYVPAPVSQAEELVREANYKFQKRFQIFEALIDEADASVQIKAYETLAKAFATATRTLL